MNTSQINHVLKKCKFFGGAVPCDKIPTKFKKPIIFIINTDPISEKGEHWTALAITKKGRGLFFCPFGFFPIAPALLSYLDKRCKRSLVYSCKSIQHTSSSLCGLYCIDFVLKLSKRWSYERFLKQFSTNTIDNDRLVLRLYKGLSN
jgi:hypothetical protein